MNASRDHWDWLDSLPKEPSQPPRFNINNEVTFINDYGIEFPNKTIVNIEFLYGQWRYYLAPSDCPWFPDYEHQPRQEFNINDHV